MGLLKPDSVSNPPIARLQNKKKNKNHYFDWMCNRNPDVFETATAKICSELSDFKLLKRMSLELH